MLRHKPIGGLTLRKASGFVETSPDMQGERVGLCGWIERRRLGRIVETNTVSFMKRYRKEKSCFLSFFSLMKRSKNHPTEHNLLKILRLS